MRHKTPVKNLFGLVIALGVVGIAIGCCPSTQAPEVEIPPMDPYLAIWNNGDLGLVDELYARTSSGTLSISVRMSSARLPSRSS